MSKIKPALHVTKDMAQDYGLIEGTPLFALPDTHCIVPKEPDEKMKNAGDRAQFLNSCRYDKIYKAMITAYQEEE